MAPRGVPLPEKIRLYSANEDRGYATPCRIWQRAKNGDGYAIVRDGKRLVLAHRAAYEAARGPIPAGMNLDHLCRQRDCVNPAHLEAVTQAANVRRGARTVLRPADVAEIRAAVEAEGPTAVGRRFGVSETAVRAIRDGRRWAA